MTRLLLFHGGVPRDSKVEDWFHDPASPLRLMLRPWFEAIRACGPDVRELLHDGCPTATVLDAGFAYVNAFRSHAAVGFFRGAALPDPAGLLEGSGRAMRHVKLRPGQPLDTAALHALIKAAHDDIRAALAAPPSSPGFAPGRGFG